VREELDTQLYTTIHEAAHAVLYVTLRLGCRGVTAIADHDDMSAGSVTHDADNPLDEEAQDLMLLAPESYWLRHATAAYAGVEGARRGGDPEPEAGSDHDEGLATGAIERITGDEQCMGLLAQLARRRAAMLVEHYWPEIELTAKALRESGKLSGDDVRGLVAESLRARHAPLLPW
jgi:hypothetical protein